MHKVLTLPPTLLPRTSVDLGWLVLSKTNPTQDYHALPVPASSTLVVPSQNHLTRSTSSTGATLRTQLTKHLSAHLKASSDSIVDISAAEATSYVLKNSQEWYDAQRFDAHTKRWLERAVQCGSDVHVIIGLYTLHDVRVSRLEDRGTNVSGATSVGITDFAALGSAAIATAVPGAARNVLDVMAGVGGKVRRKTEQSWKAEGELVYAVQYRKVQFKWYFSKRVEESFLGKGNRWKVLWGTRSDDDEDEEDVVEAVLDEDQESSGDDVIVIDDGDELR